MELQKEFTNQELTLIAFAEITKSTTLTFQSSITYNPYEFSAN